MFVFRETILPLFILDKDLNFLLSFLVQLVVLVSTSVYSHLFSPFNIPLFPTTHCFSLSVFIQSCCFSSYPINCNLVIFSSRCPAHSINKGDTDSIKAPDQWDQRDTLHELKMWSVCGWKRKEEIIVFPPERRELLQSFWLDASFTDKGCASRVVEGWWGALVREIFHENMLAGWRLGMMSRFYKNSFWQYECKIDVK